MIDASQGCEGSARGRSGAAGASRGKTTLLALVFFLIRLDLTWAAGGFSWKWGTLGGTCTATCSSVALACVEKFSKINSGADFEAAKGSVSCSSYGGASDSWIPGKCSGCSKQCYYQTGSGGECITSHSFMTRLCSCQCAAGTFSNSDLKSWPCEE